MDAATPAVEDPDAAARPSRRTSVHRALVSGLLVVVMVVAFGWALAGKWTEIVENLRDQNPAVVLTALLVALVGVFLSFLLWRGILATLGSGLAVRSSSRLFFVTQLGKYLPGAVWPVLAQMRMGREVGVPKQRMGLAFLLTLGLSTLVGILVGLAALPALLEAEGPVVLLGLLALPLLVLLLVPRVLNWLLGTALRVLRRPGLDRPLGGRDVVRGVGSALLFWLVYGGHVWVLAVGMGADPLRALPVAIGGFAIAFSLGPLLVVLPAGAGVREAVLVVLLSGVLTTSEATAVALTSRGILMAVDGLLALAAGVIPRPHLPHHHADTRG